MKNNTSCSELSAVASLIRRFDNFPKAGVTFLDANPIFASPEACSLVVDYLVSRTESFLCGLSGSSVIVAPEARGFILAPVLASRLSLPFVPIRKAGRLPRTSSLLSASYDMEYSSETVEVDLIGRSYDNVILYDDVLATGGTAAACAGFFSDSRLFMIFMLEIEFLGGRGLLLDRGLVDDSVVSLFSV